MTHRRTVVVFFNEIAALAVGIPAMGKALEQLASFDTPWDKEFPPEGLTLADIS